MERKLTTKPEQSEKKYNNKQERKINIHLPLDRCPKFQIKLLHHPPSPHVYADFLLFNEKVYYEIFVEFIVFPVGGIAFI